MTAMRSHPWGRVRRRRPQGGYVLATILGLLILSTLLLLAMLSVSQSTIRIEQTGRVRERQARAAEAAVEVAVNQIRNSQTTATADPIKRKETGDAGYLAGKPDHEHDDGRGQTTGGGMFVVLSSDI